MAADPKQQLIPPEPSGVVVGSMILFVMSAILTVGMLCAVFWPDIYDWTVGVIFKMTH